MKSKLKTFIAVVGVLAVATAISLITVSRGSLYGQAGDDNWSSNLIKTWTGEAVAYSYKDVTNPLDIPVYGDRTMASGCVQVTKVN